MEGKLDKVPNDKVTLDDWQNHLTTLFPQVRLKQYLELRSMDACSWNEICGQPAFWTGILYDNDCLDEVNNIIKDWTLEDKFFLYKNAPIYGLASPFKKGKLIDIARLLLKISQTGLKNRNFVSNGGSGGSSES